MKMLFTNKNISSKDKRGFTVIEAFVGITILLIGVVGPMVLVNRNFQAARFSRDQITAYYLAQEAVEMVRQVRDTNLLRISNGDESRSWNADLSCSSGCRVDLNVSEGQGGDRPNPLPRVNSCDAGGCNTSNSRLYIDTAGRFSHNNTGTPTAFSRYVRISGNEITVTVEFNAGRYNQTYETVSIITDWTPE